MTRAAERREKRAYTRVFLSVWVCNLEFGTLRVGRGVLCAFRLHAQVTGVGHHALWRDLASSRRLEMGYLGPIPNTQASGDTVTLAEHALSNYANLSFRRVFVVQWPMHCSPALHVFSCAPLTPSWYRIQISSYIRSVIEMRMLEKTFNYQKIVE
jgi:hypothetical protein